MDTGGLVFQHHGISSHSAENEAMCFQLLWYVDMSGKRVIIGEGVGLLPVLSQAITSLSGTRN